MQGRLLSAAFCVLLPSSATATHIKQISYEQDKAHFEWILEWNAALPAADHATFLPIGPGLSWSVSIGFFALHDDRLVNDWLFNAFHLMGPHDEDRNPGGFTSILLNNVNLLASTFDPATNDVLEKPLAHRIRKHPIETPPPPHHSDVYDLSYLRGSATGTVIFIFKGEHFGRVVPEPSASLFLGIGFAALAVVSRLGSR
jgi:hypothetical protein